MRVMRQNTKVYMFVYISTEKKKVNLSDEIIIECKLQFEQVAGTDFKGGHLEDTPLPDSFLTQVLFLENNNSKILVS